MNFEKRKTVIFMIFFTPYWVSGTKGYLAKTLFEATKWIRASVMVEVGSYGWIELR